MARRSLPTTGKTRKATQTRRVFDATPITLQAFVLRTRAALPRGIPTFEACLADLAYARANEDSAPYWVGDMLRYVESRADWREKLSQALDVTGWARHTAENYTSISKRVAASERQLSPSIGHADVVASLSAHEQRRWLKQAATEGWSVRELRQAVRRASRSSVVAGQAPTIHVVSVTIEVSVEASTTVAAEDVAWRAMKSMASAPPPPILHARVVAAHVVPSPAQKVS